MSLTPYRCSLTNAGRSRNYDMFRYCQRLSSLKGCTHEEGSHTTKQSSTPRHIATAASTQQRTPYPCKRDALDLLKMQVSQDQKARKRKWLVSHAARVPT